MESAAPGPALVLLEILVRGFGDAAALTAAGTLAFLAINGRDCRPEAPVLRRVVLAAGLLALLAIGLDLVLHSAAEAGAPWALFADAELAGILLDTPRGEQAALRFLGLALVLFALVSPLWLGIFGGLLIATSFVLTGHAGTPLNRGLAATAIVLHSSAAGLWLGSLPGLALVAGARNPARAERVFLNFGRRVAWTLGLVFLAGLALLWLLAGLDRAALGGAYGATIAAKLLLLLLLLGLYLYELGRLVPALGRGAAGARRRLRLAVLAEGLLLLSAIFLGVAASGLHLAPS